MPKSAKNAKQRFTREQTAKLYPKEWVIFVEPKVDQETTTFIDGVVVWHGADQKECYRRLGKIKAPSASFYMGVIPYRKYVSDELNAKNKKVA